jgi:hypothetical protein
MASLGALLDAAGLLQHAARCEECGLSIAALSDMPGRELDETLRTKVGMAASEVTKLREALRANAREDSLRRQPSTLSRAASALRHRRRDVLDDDDEPRVVLGVSTFFIGLAAVILFGLARGPYAGVDASAMVCQDRTLDCVGSLFATNSTPAAPLDGMLAGAGAYGARVLVLASPLATADGAVAGALVCVAGAPDKAGTSAYQLAAYRGRRGRYYYNVADYDCSAGGGAPPRNETEQRFCSACLGLVGVCDEPSGDAGGQSSAACDWLRAAGALGTAIRALLFLAAAYLAVPFLLLWFGGVAHWLGSLACARRAQRQEVCLGAAAHRICSLPIVRRGTAALAWLIWLVPIALVALSGLLLSSLSAAAVPAPLGSTMAFGRQSRVAVTACCAAYAAILAAAVAMYATEARRLARARRGDPSGVALVSVQRPGPNGNAAVLASGQV